MKLNLAHPILVKAAAFVAVNSARMAMRTIRSECIALDASADPWTTRRGNILCLWHEMIVPGTCLLPNRGIQVLVSQSRDGDLITEFIEGLGFSAVRGSSSRGAVKAIREMARSTDRGNLGITPDGPRGPRRQFQPGAVFLASRTGLPLVPLGIATSNCLRLPSWDRFVIPLPFSRMVYLAGHPIHVPPDADLEMLDVYRQRIVSAMDELEQLAQDRLAGRVTKDQLLARASGPSDDSAATRKSA